MAAAIHSIGLFEAKTHLSELVARAEQGEETIITRHNKPVARIVPLGTMPGFDAQRRRLAVDRMKDLGERLAARSGAVTKEEIADWIRDGRK